MTELLQIAAGNFLSPIVLFFALGVAAGYVRSDLSIPEPISKSLSLYLMLAIGFKGGVALAASGISSLVVVALIMAVSLSLVLPVIAFSLLRVATSLDTRNAAAIAAHYGSVSIVTFVAATSFLEYRDVRYEGFLVAMLAVMETPAIITGLLLARRASDRSSAYFSPRYCCIALGLARWTLYPASCSPSTSQYQLNVDSTTTPTRSSWYVLRISRMVDRMTTVSFL